MAAYLEALEAHQEAADPKKAAAPVPVSDWLRNRIAMEGDHARH